MECLKKYVGLIAAIVIISSFAQGSELPNVVMIMADDLGWSDIAAYRRYQGLDEPIATPNLDRLCAEGMMFTDAHSTAALCAPTRFGMMTGSNPYRNGRQSGTWGFTDGCALNANGPHTSVGEIAQGGGYRTAFLGKMHLGGGAYTWSEKMPKFPSAYGFDYSFNVHDGIQNSPYAYFENDYFVKIDPTTDPLNPSVRGDSDDIITWASGSYPIANGTGIITSSKSGKGDIYWNSSQNAIINSRKAVAFIDDHLTNHSDKPFMMYYCPPQVHVPNTPPIDFDPDALGNPHSPPNVPVEGATGGNGTADVIYELDLQVGRILDKLEDPDGDGDTSDSILADTLVMFTSDNGGTSDDRGFTGYDSTGPLRGFKSDQWEGGHRVPFIARWGDGTQAGSRIKPNSVSDQIIGTHDWVGLMYAMTDTEMQINQAMDCVNILPILLGEQPESEPLRDFLIIQGDPDEGLIRQGDYVLIINLTTSRSINGFFNLATDFAQETDLQDDPDQQQRITEMKDLYMQHDQRTETRSTPYYNPPVGVGVWDQDLDVPLWAIPNLLRTDGFLVKASNLNGTAGGASAVTFGNIDFDIDTSNLVEMTDSNTTYYTGTDPDLANLLNHQGKHFGNTTAGEINFSQLTVGGYYRMNIICGSYDSGQYTKVVAPNGASVFLGNDAGTVSLGSLTFQATDSDITFQVTGIDPTDIETRAEVLAYSFYKVQIDDGTNGPPTFTSDPVNEIDAPIDIAYSSSIADNAFDFQGDPMSFSEVSDQTWLTVSPNGDLSGTPSTGDIGLNVFTVLVEAEGGSHQATLNITVYIPDNTKPTPDPMTFASAPTTTGQTSICMIASTASDDSGVEYYFTCTAGGSNDSPWQASATYEDTGLTPGTQYTYTVTARDLSQNQNATAASDEASAATEPRTASFASCDMGYAEISVVSLADLDAVSTGATWLWDNDSMSTSIVADASSSDHGLIFNNDITADVTGRYLEFNLGADADFSDMSHSFSFDFTKARSGDNKAVTVYGYGPQDSVIFQVYIDCDGGEEISVWLDPAQSTDTGIETLQLANDGNYDQSAMTPFRIILDPYNAGSELTYEIASYSGSAGFLTSERQLSRIKFEITGSSNKSQGFWLDNLILVNTTPIPLTDLAGLAALSSYWLDSGVCVSSDWCDGYDYDKSGTVDTYDLTEFALDWLSQEL